MSADNCILVIRLNDATIVFDNVSVSHLDYVTVNDFEGNTFMPRGSVVELPGTPTVFQSGDSSEPGLRGALEYADRLESGGYYEYGIREAYAPFPLERVSFQDWFETEDDPETG